MSDSQGVDQNCFSRTELPETLEAGNQPIRGRRQIGRHDNLFKYGLSPFL
jgi:hypothetical protein